MPIQSVTLTDNALKVLRQRYFMTDETPEALFKRVADYIASIERNSSYWSNRFYEMMARLEFLPNSPCLFNAGTPRPQMSACFVLGVEDHLDSILDTQMLMAKIHSSGGGTGFDFTPLQPINSSVNYGRGYSSGPCSFMQMYSDTTKQITQGGIRRGANMGCMSVYHPDIMQFVTYKTIEGTLSNFNISVLIDKAFLEAVKNNQKVELSHNGKVYEIINARTIFDAICHGIWTNGEPGILFMDRIEEGNLLKGEGLLRPNPCAEQLLLPYESCNLGSINLAKFVDQYGQFDYDNYELAIYDATRFLDNVINLNLYLDPRIKERTLRSRKIGLGIMGLAKALAKMRIKYDSWQALDFSEKIAEMLYKVSIESSTKLGEERGYVEGFRRRNVNTCCVAPTGSLSIIANCWSSIEPYIKKKFKRYLSFGTLTEEYSEDPQCFRSSYDISHDFHLKMLNVWSKYVDSSVSKTINFSHDTPVSVIEDVIFKAYDLGNIKGLTMYRNDSRKEQVVVNDDEQESTSKCSIPGNGKGQGSCVDCAL